MTKRRSAIAEPQRRMIITLSDVAGPCMGCGKGCQTVEVDFHGWCCSRACSEGMWDMWEEAIERRGEELANNGPGLTETSET